MCGRYATGDLTWAAMRAWLALIPGLPPATAQADAELAPRYNVAPTTPAPILRAGAQGCEGGLARWGLIPPWARGPLRGFRAATINARIETVAERPSFRDSLARRCLVPAIGYFEWFGAGAARAPWFITVARNSPGLCFAGLWSTAALDDFRGVSFTILTRAAAGPIAALHDRMPLILDESGYAPWLAGSAPVAAAVGVEPSRLRAHPVGSAIGQVRAEGSGLIAPAPPPAPRLI